MLVLSVKIFTPSNIAVSGAFSRTGSKSISLNARDRCQRRVTQFFLATYKGLKLRLLSSKRRMTNHSWRQNNKKWNKSFQILRKVISSLFKPKRLIWVKVHTVKYNWLATKRTLSRLLSRRSRKHPCRPVRSKKHSLERLGFRNSSTTSTSVGSTQALKTKTPYIWRSNMLLKVICFTSSVKRSFWARIRRFISSYRFVPESIICISRDLFIEISNPKTFSLRMAISSKSVTSAGASNLITCNKETLSVVR